jgi:AraC family transcriptional regulator of adaptative response / DNA-3-methyladenine glycosylase II
VVDAGDAWGVDAAPLTHLFPSPAELLDAPDDAFAMPAARRRALRGLAAAVADGSLVLDPGADRGAARHRLLSLEGIGEWTADYVAMRAFGDPDAFLPGDLGVRRAFARLGLADDRAAVGGRAERWRPWRAYAVAHLWAMDAAGPTGTAGGPGTAGNGAAGTRLPGTKGTEEDAA